MKRIFFLLFIALTAVSCVKQEITVKRKIIQPGDQKPDPDPITEPDYYINLKVDGIAFSLTEVSGSRVLTNPRGLIIEGNAKGGLLPKFKFSHQESSIGFVPGLNLGSSTGTFPSHYAEFVNSSNILYETENDRDGVHFFISEISYTNGGFVAGSFSGSMKTKSGATIQITEGKFKVKFKN
jgi:hypothetical protein